MLHPDLRHYMFVHRFVEAVTWQPLRQTFASRSLVRASGPTMPTIPARPNQPSLGVRAA